MEKQDKTVVKTTNAAGCRSVPMTTESTCLFLDTVPFAGVLRAPVSGSSLRLIPDGALTQQLGEDLLLEKYLLLHLRCSRTLTVQPVSQEAELSLLYI